MSFAFRVQGSRATRGDPPLSLALNQSEIRVDVDLNSAPPDQAQTVVTSPGDFTVLASASGGDGSYSYAWVVTELQDGGQEGASSSLTTAGTQNQALYDTSRFTIIMPALISGGAPVEPPPAFGESRYRARCTVTDGNSDTAVADCLFTLAGA